MRISCACSFSDCRDGLQKSIRDLGLEPTVTSQLIQIQYEGGDLKVINSLIELFEREPDHDICFESLKKRP